MPKGTQIRLSLSDIKGYLSRGWTFADEQTAKVIIVDQESTFKLEEVTLHRDQREPQEEMKFAGVKDDDLEVMQDFKVYLTLLLTPPYWAPMPGFALQTWPRDAEYTP